MTIFSIAIIHNSPVCWTDAVVISKALVSGVSVSEKELQTIRTDDAKSSCNVAVN
jgi:hypothetical protein